MLEKFYIFLTRWIVLISTTIALIAVVLAAIYATKLFYQSQDTAVNEEPYHQKQPQVGFDEIKEIQEKKLKEFVKKRDYVIQVIEQGSSGHGYPLEVMPAKLVKERNATKALAEYVASGLKKRKRPAEFTTCTRCHGSDGRGSNGKSPDLTILPIYHGLRPKVVSARKEVAKSYTPSRNEPVKKVKSEMEKLIDRIGSNINRYAMYVDQPGVAKRDLYRMLSTLSNGLSQNGIELYLQQLSKATDRLLEYGKSYKMQQRDILPPMDWREFLLDFTKRFKSFVAEEEQKAQAQQMRIKEERMRKEMRAAQARSQLYQVGIAIGVAILIFLVLTIVLVLLKIERNTRQKEEKEPDSIENALQSGDGEEAK